MRTDAQIQVTISEDGGPVWQPTEPYLYPFWPYGEDLYFVRGTGPQEIDLAGYCHLFDGAIQNVTFAPQFASLPPGVTLVASQGICKLLYDGVSPAALGWVQPGAAARGSGWKWQRFEIIIHEPGETDVQWEDPMLSLYLTNTVEGPFAGNSTWHGLTNDYPAVTAEDQAAWELELRKLDERHLRTIYWTPPLGQYYSPIENPDNFLVYYIPG